MPRYLESSAGRALVLAAGLILTGLGLSSLLAASLAGRMLAVIAPILAIAVAVASVQLGYERFPLRSLAVCLVCPLILVPAFVGAGARGVLAPAASHVLVAAGIAMLATFVLLSLQSPWGVRHARREARASEPPPREDVSD